MQIEVPAGHLAEIRAGTAAMGYSPSDCVFAAIGQTLPAVGDVEGTTWAGKDSRGDFHTWQFLAGGVLYYTLPSGSGRWIPNAWQQEGARVTWETYMGTERYVGTITGDRLTGTARTLQGLTRRFSLTQQREP